MLFSTASVRTNMSRRTQCSNGLQPSADSKRDCPNSRGNLFFAFFLGGGKWVMIRETASSFSKKHHPRKYRRTQRGPYPRKHQLAKRGPYPRKHRRKLAWEAVCADHTHIITMITLPLQKRKSKTRISALRFRTIPYILNSHSQHTVLTFGISGENSFILEIAPLVTLRLRSCAPHRQRASVRFRLRISGHKTTPQNKCYRRAPLGE